MPSGNVQSWEKLRLVSRLRSPSWITTVWPTREAYSLPRENSSAASVPATAHTVSPGSTPETISTRMPSLSPVSTSRS